MREYLEQFKDLSEEDLIEKMHQYREWSEPYRAASLLLKLKQKDREKNAETIAKSRHEEVMGDSSRLVRFALWTLAVAILTLIATVLFGVVQLHDTKTSSISQLELPTQMVTNLKSVSPSNIVTATETSPSNTTTQLIVTPPKLSATNK